MTLPLPFDTTPLAETFGAEILGMALHEDAPEEVFTGIKQLLAHQSVVVLRGQNLSEQQQIAVTRRIGPPAPIHEHIWAPPVTMDAKPGDVIRWGDRLSRLPLINKGELIYFCSGPGLCEKDIDTYSLWDQEERHDKGRGSACWHTGDTEKFDYELLSMLYAEVAAVSGGDTFWCDTATPYDVLDDATKAKLDRLRVIHYFNYKEGSPPISQPLVKTHPITGRKHFYLNFVTMERIEGFEREESFALIKWLFDHHIQPQFIYRHVWSDGDIVMWNNNSTMHRRGVLTSGVRRIMRRTQAQAPEFQSTAPWDKTRLVVGHDGGDWFPYLSFAAID